MRPGEKPGRFSYLMSIYGPFSGRYVVVMFVLQTEKYKQSGQPIDLTAITPATKSPPVPKS